MSDDLINALKKEALEDADIIYALSGDIKMLRAEADYYHGEWQKAVAEITRLRAENARLRVALEPFADMAAQWKPGVMFLPMPDEHSVLVEYIYLRKASEAINDPR